MEQEARNDDAVGTGVETGIRGDAACTGDEMMPLQCVKRLGVVWEMGVARGDALVVRDIVLRSRRCNVATLVGREAEFVLRRTPLGLYLPNAGWTRCISTRFSIWPRETSR